MTEKGLPYERPAALQRKWAAAYCGVGVDHFDDHIRPHVACIYLGDAKLWRTDALDRFLAEQERIPVVSGRKAKRPRTVGAAGGMAHEESAS